MAHPGWERIPRTAREANSLPYSGWIENQPCKDQFIGLERGICEGIGEVNKEKQEKARLYRDL